MSLRLLPQLSPRTESPAGPRPGPSPSSSSAVSVDELLALRGVDLVVSPELAGELGHPTMHAPVGGDHLRLGPPPAVSSEPAFVHRAVGAMLDLYEKGRSLPAQASAEGAVSEARMIAVLTQLHRLQLEIHATARRTV